MGRSTPKIEHRTHVSPAGERITYEHYEGFLPAADVVHAPSFKDNCSHCPTRGRNFACPPHSPTFAEHAKGVVRLRVICVRMPIRDPSAVRNAFDEARGLLLAELDEWRSHGARVLGSGECVACQTCAAATGGDGCVAPAQRTYSLESLGVNVSALVLTALGLRLEWEMRRFVCSVGAVCEYGR
jgi:predicted metal-binding protein